MQHRKRIHIRPAGRTPTLTLLNWGATSTSSPRSTRRSFTSTRKDRLILAGHLQPVPRQGDIHRQFPVNFSMLPHLMTNMRYVGLPG